MPRHGSGMTQADPEETHTQVTSAGDNDDIRVLQNVPLNRAMCATASITPLQQLLYTQGATQGSTPLYLFMMLSSSVFSPRDAGEGVCLRDKGREEQWAHLATA